MRQRSGDYFSFATGKLGWRPRSVFLSWVVLLGLTLPALAGAQPNMASIHFDDQTRVFRIDAADMSYVLGINENKQVQTLYFA
jgi:alpha-galactosidase